MDRKIPRLSRVCRFVLWTGMAALVSHLCLTTQIRAQEGRSRGGGPGGGFRMPSPEESFANLDSNSDGHLSPEEISSNGFVGRMFRDTDTSKGLSRDQFLGEMQKIRERFGQRGGPDGGRRRDRGGDEESRDGSSQERSGERPNGDAGSNPGTTPAAGSQPGTPAAAATPVRPNRPRITVDLQDDLRSGDTDGDGQIGLYEWRRFSGRSLGEFQQFDQNQDGFVTPREVAVLRPETTTPAATATTTTPPVAPTAGTPPSAGPPAASPVTPPTNATTPPAASATPVDPRTTRAAERDFRLLDKNNDKQISSDEWEQSRRIRTIFSDNGVDLAQPMSVADFTSHYARLKVQ